ncbi:hypothetical protein HPP92_005946 [Vanilla planifolia]|uniref:Transmembrane 9 superfamily member n=1 Tax=Vanilla planifolia TaxID=51239 RepID=A0A835VCQ1_VANPL|nr:hypothetical protein HPP92_005946 [Vanilla planifolia]
MAEPVKDEVEALGEVLNGDRSVLTMIRKKKLLKEEVAKFKRAIDKDYYFQMYYDDLPAWVFIGRVDRGAETDPCHLMTAASYHVLH